MSKSKTKHILAVVKVLLAVGLLAWVFRDVNPSPSSFLATLRRARPGLLACALAGFVASLVIIALRLRLLLRTQRIEIRLWEVIRLTFLGQFFNAVVPGVVGGDLVKAYYVMKHTPHKGAAMVTVFVDRLMGLTELVALAVAMILCLWAGGRVSAESLHGPMVATAAALAVVSGLFCSARVSAGCSISRRYTAVCRSPTTSNQPPRRPCNFAAIRWTCSRRWA